MTTQTKKKTKQYKFWIRSSRGTDEFEIVDLPIGLHENEILARLDAWCSKSTLFGAWHVSENTVSYGVEELPTKD